MSAELVKRLRASRAVWEDGRSHPTDDEAEAADRIEALTAELAKAVEALRVIKVASVCSGTREQARAVLAEIENSEAVTLGEKT